MLLTFLIGIERSIFISLADAWIWYRSIERIELTVSIIIIATSITNNSLFPSGLPEGGYTAENRGGWRFTQIIFLLIFSFCYNSLTFTYSFMQVYVLINNNNNVRQWCKSCTFSWGFSSKICFLYSLSLPN